jgi:hypothetical protein
MKREPPAVMRMSLTFPSDPGLVRPWRMIRTNVPTDALQTAGVLGDQTGCRIYGSARIFCFRTEHYCIILVLHIGELLLLLVCNSSQVNSLLR